MTSKCPSPMTSARQRRSVEPANPQPIKENDNINTKSDSDDIILPVKARLSALKPDRTADTKVATVSVSGGPTPVTKPSTTNQITFYRYECTVMGLNHYHNGTPSKGDEVTLKREKTPGYTANGGEAYRVFHLGKMIGNIKAVQFNDIQSILESDPPRSVVKVSCKNHKSAYMKSRVLLVEYTGEFHPPEWLSTQARRIQIRTLKGRPERASELCRPVRPRW